MEGLNNTRRNRSSNVDDISSAKPKTDVISKAVCGGADLRWTKAARFGDSLDESKADKEDVEQWVKRIQSQFIRLVNQASRSKAGRALVEKMLDELEKKIFELTMKNEVAAKGDLEEDAEYRTKNVKGMKKREGRKRMKRSNPSYETSHETSSDEMRESSVSGWQECGEYESGTSSEASSHLCDLRLGPSNIDC